MVVLEEFFLRSTIPSILLGTVSLLLFFFLFSYKSSFQKHGKEPPGPRPLPFIGNLLQLGFKLPHRSLIKLARRYGSIYTFHFGPKKAVIVTGYKTIKSILLNHGQTFALRPIDPIIHDVHLTYGIIFSSGDSWKEMRRFATSALKDFGMGKKAIEEKIIEECQHLFEVITKKEGKPFDTDKAVNYAVSNIICSIVYGKRYQYDDKEFTTRVERALTHTQLLGSPLIQLYNMYPWLKWIPRRKHLMKSAAAMREQVTNLIEGLHKTLNPNMCRCFVDAFLARKKQLEESGNMNSHYHKDNLLTTVMNLFGAGTETTSTTVRYGLLIMAKYPKIQDQVQEELSRVIGSRQIRVEDRKNLPYTDAVIHETQRMADIVPMLNFCPTEDVTLQGFLIQKGTPVYSMLPSVHQDESEWESPSTFKPSRFLDKNGTFVKRDAFMVFSAGPRSCIGEGLARMEIFLFFSSLLQRFRFTPPPGVTEDELDLDPVLGLILSPTPHQLCAHPLHPT